MDKDKSCCDLWVIVRLFCEISDSPGTFSPVVVARCNCESWCVHEQQWDCLVCIYVFLLTGLIHALLTHHNAVSVSDTWGPFPKTD